MAKIKTIKYVQNIAKEKGFKVLSTDYLNNRTKYLWECPNKHQWLARFGPIRDGTGCPFCSGRRKDVLEMKKMAKRTTSAAEYFFISKDELISKAIINWGDEYFN